VLTGFGLVGLCRRIPERLFLIATLAFGVTVIAIGYSGALSGPLSHTVQHLLQTKLNVFRNVSKFSPDVSLALALGVAWCLSTPFWGNAGQKLTRPLAQRWHSNTTRPAFISLTGIRVLAVAAIVLASAPFWQGNLYRPGGFSAIPNYWTQMGRWLDTHQGHQNAMLVPGSPFGTYTWGYPSDEPPQIVSDTSVEYRNLIPIGTNGYIQMLDAVEQVIDDGNPAPGLATYLSRGGVKYVIERNDLNWRSTGSPPPVQVHQVLAETSGLTEVASFGPKLKLTQTEYDDLPVYDKSSYAGLRALQIFAVKPQSSAVQVYAASDPVIVSGDAGSLLPLSAQGILNGRASVLSGDPKAPGVNQEKGATWAITDGNQLRYRGFGSIRSNSSYLLSPGQTFSSAPPDIPKNFQVVTGLKHETVAYPIGAASVTASSFGSSLLVNDPEQGPASAFDGDSTTSWVANATNNSVGQWVSITFNKKMPMSAIVLKPLQGNKIQPAITRVTISTDRGSVIRKVPLDTKSVRLTVPSGSSKHLRVTIDAVKLGADAHKPGAFVVGAGITDVDIPGIKFTPRMKVPNDESSTFSNLNRTPPVVSFSKNVPNPNPLLGEQASDDPNMARYFSLPKSMNAKINGYAEGTAVGGALERILQSLTPTQAPTAVQASASSWIGNLPLFRPQNLVDGSTQPWIAAVNDANPSITLHWQRAQTINSISLTPSPVASRPTEIHIEDPGGASFTLPVPKSGGVIPFFPITTNSLTIRFTHVIPKISLTPFDVLFTVPVGLSNIGVPDLEAATPLPASTGFFLRCGQGPTLILDGQAIPTAMYGTVSDLIDFRPMPFVACGPKSGLALKAGAHNFAAPSAKSAFVTTSVVIQSTSAAPKVPTHRKATVELWSANFRTVSVGSGPATDLAIDQNFNIGWRAKLGTETLQPIRIDGWQQGFEVPAGAAGTITVVMTPDNELRDTLLVGVLLLVGLVLLALVRTRRRSPEPLRPTATPSFLVLLIASLVLLVLVGGPLALVGLPLLGIARRWGGRVIAAIAFLAFLVAGVAAAIHPAVVNHSGAYAFDGPAQAASVVAFAAVLAALAARRDYAKRTEEPVTTPESVSAESDLPETDSTPTESTESASGEAPDVKSPVSSAVD
jgi:arabinofuranan 3-O-arabinosyltransferase